MRLKVVLMPTSLIETRFDVCTESAEFLTSDLTTRPVFVVVNTGQNTNEN